MVGNASGIDLNNAEMHDLDRIGGLGRVRALRIIQNRPIRRWADLEKIEGFDHDLVNDLRGSGAKLGRPKPKPRSEKKPYSRQLRQGRSQAQQLADANAKRRSGRTRPAHNIFSGEGEGPR
jgi:hypothetical protein